ncbi:MAG: SDR family oxidoreductase [Pseudomonadota bacterium]
MNETLEPGTVLITGANRGLGLEFCRQYLANGWTVIGACRQPDAATDLAALDAANLEILALDVAIEDAVTGLAEKLANRPLDILINNAGVFGPKPKAENDFRQSFGQLSYPLWAEVLRINTQAPVQLAESLLPNLKAGRHRKVITISSTEGSIASAPGGLYAYRTSKAAVNMAMALLAKDLAAENILVASINPGWVKTDMGGPQAVLEVEDSIRSVRRTIDQLTPENTGGFFDYDGSTLPW